jgi:aminoglycoside 6'-N-acetyltransferase I
LKNNSEEIFVHIIDLTPNDESLVEQTATMLYDGFQEIWPHICPNIDAARVEVHRSFASGKISRVAVTAGGLVLGWIGAVPDYDGNAWCLYPLVVHSDYRQRGIGRALVNDLERLTRKKGAVTLYLGTDDTAGMTTLGNTSLYPNVLEHLANIRNLRRHPYEFYQKLGFVIVGVIPDANGLGKPDIFMSKRVANYG